MDDPLGTPVRRKITVAALLGAVPVDVLPASNQSLGSATLPWVSSFIGTTTQYESVVSSAGLITHAALGSATNISIVMTPRGSGSLAVKMQTLSAPFIVENFQGLSGLWCRSTHMILAGTTGLTEVGAQGAASNQGFFSTYGLALGDYATGTAPTGKTLLLGSDVLVKFSSTTVPTGTPDVGFNRNAAGIIGVGTGAAGSFAGSLKLTGMTMAAGGTLSLSSGTNQRAGNLTLVGGTLTVSNTTVTSNTIVILTRKTSGGTIGTAITYSVNAGTSFTVQSDNILDTSVFSYVLVEVP